MKFFSRFSVAIAAAVSITSATTLTAQARPAAADIIAKYVAAIGGDDAIMKITSLKQVATMEVPAMGLVAPMEIYSAAPNKMASKTNIPGMGDMLNGFDGTVAWDVNPMQGPRLLAGKELAEMNESADFYGNLLFLADRYESMDVVSDTTIRGENAYTVKMVRKGSGGVSYSHFSVKSGLLLGGSSTRESAMGPIQSNSVFSEYKTFGGLLMPTKVDVSMGPQTMVMTLKEVIINGAPDSAFAIPEQAKALIKK